MRSFFRRIFSKPEPDAHRIGRLGEKEGERLLKSKGYRILARNWRAGKDEIDLICKDQRALVFVETRTRSRNALVGGYDSIDHRKKQALRRVCRAYLKSLKPQPATFRFDVIEAIRDGDEIIETRHHENVPLFSKAEGRGNS